RAQRRARPWSGSHATVTAARWRRLLPGPATRARAACGRLRVMFRFWLYWMGWVSVATAFVSAPGCASSATTRVPPSAAATAVAPERQAPIDAQEETQIVYPETLREDIVDTIHGVAVADPYRWLENTADERVQAWMNAQDRLAREYLGALSARASLEARLRE